MEEDKLITVTTEKNETTDQKIADCKMKFEPNEVTQYYEHESVDETTNIKLEKEEDYLNNAVLYNVSTYVNTHSDNINTDIIMFQLSSSIDIKQETEELSGVKQDDVSDNFQNVNGAKEQLVGSTNQAKLPAIVPNKINMEVIKSEAKQQYFSDDVKHPLDISYLMQEGKELVKYSLNMFEVAVVFNNQIDTPIDLLISV